MEEVMRYSEVENQGYEIRGDERARSKDFWLSFFLNPDLIFPLSSQKVTKL